MKRTVGLYLFLVVLVATSAGWAVTPSACFTVTNNATCSSWTVNASCSGSTNAGTSYIWYFDDGGTTAQIFSGKSVTRTGLASGPWRVTLLVDNNGYSSNEDDSATDCFWVCCVGPCGSC